jgi:flagellar biosynthetic protein FlhB
MAEKCTEAGSPQHKRKARQQGDSVRSRELLSAVAMLAGVLTAGVVANAFVANWRGLFEQSLNAAAVRDDGSELQWIVALHRLMGPALLPLGAVLAASFLGALGVGVAQGGGLSIHPNAIGFKLSKLNPATNLGNIFSLRGAARVMKSLVPAAVMVVFGWMALKALMLPMPVLSIVRLPHAFSAAYGLAVDAAFVTLAWSGLDYTVEWVAWNQRMKMTKQQLKDEVKETIGNPQVKARIRQAQNAMRRRKVKADIAKASVVITNPIPLRRCARVQLRDHAGADGVGQGARSACGEDSRGGSLGGCADDRKPATGKEFVSHGRAGTVDSV